MRGLPVVWGLSQKGRQNSILRATVKRKGPREIQGSMQVKGHGHTPENLHSPGLVDPVTKIVFPTSYEEILPRLLHSKL